MWEYASEKPEATAEDNSIEMRFDNNPVVARLNQTYWPDNLLQTCLKDDQEEHEISEGKDSFF